MNSEHDFNVVDAYDDELHLSDEELDQFDLHRLPRNGRQDEGQPNERTLIIVTPRPTVKEILSIPAHPFYFAKTLIQLGYEPLPPYRAASLLGFGPMQLYLPGVISYLRYIQLVDGTSGLFRGLGCSIVQGTILRWTSRKIEKVIEQRMPVVPQQSAMSRFVERSLVEITARSWGVLLSQPFYVMTVRSMAQFIGGEAKYSSFNIFSNMSVIYEDEGIAGFFAGIVPRLCFEASSILLFNGLVAVGRRCIDKKDDNMDSFMIIIARMLTSTITYPLSVVSSIAAVSGSGLDAGQPPFMPVFKDWCAILSYLYNTRQLNRGSRLFIRPYKLPPKIVAHYQ